MTGNKFDEVMAKAQKLMLDENFNAAVESKAASFAGRRNVGGISSSQMTDYEAMAFGGSSLNEEKPIQMLETPSNDYNIDEDKRFAKLPAAIRESFAKTPPMTGRDTTMMGQMAKNLSLNEQPVQKPVRQQQAIPTQNMGGIDYSLIKSIIDESVQRNLREMNKGMLNENTLKGLKINKGNKIQLIDNAGNLYEAVLTLKKKAIK